MTKNIDQKIIVLGCGLSGMISALSMAKLGYKIVIIESKNISSKSFFSDPRSTAITDSSKQHLEDIDAWDALKEHVGPINDIYVIDNKAPEMLHFDSKDEHADGSTPMGYMIMNPDFKRALLKVVQSNKQITITDQTAYKDIRSTETGAEIELLDGNTLSGELAIVCDGRNSGAKRKYFTNEFEKSYSQKAITFQVEHEHAHEGTAVEHFMPAGPFAILPLKNQKMSSIVWTLDTARAEAMMALAEDEFRHMVQESFGEFLGRVEIKSPPAAFPLIAYHVGNYFQKRILLLADSAHVVHPLAGQGLNLGIKDIKELTELVAKNGISKEILTRFEKTRSPDNQNMIEITDTLNAVFSNNSSMLGAARRAGIGAIEKMSPFKQILMKYAMGRR